jgi:hypothetical protein
MIGRAVYDYCGNHRRVPEINQPGVLAGQPPRSETGAVATELAGGHLALPR